MQTVIEKLIPLVLSDFPSHTEVASNILPVKRNETRIKYNESVFD